MREQAIGAVVTGGDFQALGVLRTLARKSVPVVVLDSDRCIARYSRFPKRFFRCPKPSDKEAYVDFLIALARNHGTRGWVVFPNSDSVVYILSRYKDVLEEYYRIPTPNWEVIQNVYVKENTYRLAEKHKIPIPQTYYPKTLEELLKLDLSFPAVIKPSIRDHFYEKVKTKAFRVNDRNELVRVYSEVCSVIDPSEVLVQEFIPGGPKHLYSFCPFFKEGKALTGITARRARQHPMDFGHASTFVELVDLPELRHLGERFLSLIGYYGIAEVEFMRDPRNAEFKLIEVNPRVWGWHTLAIAAGVDLPYLLYRDMIGAPLEILTPLAQMKWVRLVTDVPTVLKEIFRGRMSVREYLASMKGKKEFAVLTRDDPLPFFAEIVMLPYLWLKRGF